jgi:heme-degrading monooxygenase HmoA
MIARVWHGYTRPTDARTYEAMLRTSILPDLHRIAGYRGCHVLHRSEGAEVEFMTITMWDSMRAVRIFAGADYEQAVIAPGAARLLSHHDDKAKHYDAAHSG